MGVVVADSVVVVANVFLNSGISYVNTWNYGYMLSYCVGCLSRVLWLRLW